jgi:hypothetical protein
MDDPTCVKRFTGWSVIFITSALWWLLEIRMIKCFIDTEAVLLQNISVDGTGAHRGKGNKTITKDSAPCQEATIVLCSYHSLSNQKTF